MKIWELSVAVNDYNQYGSYTLALFQNKPTVEEILSLPKANGLPYPRQIDKSLEEVIEILVRDGSLDGHPTGGGDSWYLSEVEVY